MMLITYALGCSIVLSYSISSTLRDNEWRYYASREDWYAIGILIACITLAWPLYLVFYVGKKL